MVASEVHGKGLACIIVTATRCEDVMIEAR
jgi:hypothetical protein